MQLKITGKQVLFTAIELALVSASPTNLDLDPFTQRVDWIEAQWVNNEYCDGPPNAMFTFYSLPNASDTFFGISTPTWPPIFFFTFMNSYPYQIPPHLCNLQSYPDLTTQCCVSSLDTSASGTNGVTSGTDVFIPSQNLDLQTFSPYVPATANSQTYCYIYNFTNSLNAYPYQSGLYLSDGSCNNALDFPVACYPDGTIKVFIGSTGGCTGSSVSHKLTTDTQVLSDALTYNNGSYSGKLIKFSSASEKIGWVSYFPQSALVPKYSNGAEVFSIMCYIVALVTTFGTIVYAVVLALKSPKLERYLMVFSQSLWLLSVIFDIAYDNTMFSSDIVLVQVRVAKLWIVNMASYSTCIYTTIVFCGLAKFSKTVNYILHSVLGVLHLVLCGGNYLLIVILAAPDRGGGIYMRLFSSGPIINSLLMFIHKTWLRAFDYWMILVMCWNIAPLTYIVFRLVNNGSKDSSIYSTIVKLYQIDIWYLVNMASQVFLLVIYLILLLVKSYSNSLSNDRAYIATYGMIQAVVAIHAVLNCIVIIRLKTIIDNSHSFVMKSITGRSSHDAIGSQDIIRSHATGGHGQSRVESNV